MQGRYFPNHVRADDGASILEILEKIGFAELLFSLSGNNVQIFCFICGAVSNKDVSMFLPLLKSSLVVRHLCLFDFRKMFQQVMCSY